MRPLSSVRSAKRSLPLFRSSCLSSLRSLPCPPRSPSLSLSRPPSRAPLRSDLLSRLSLSLFLSPCPRSRSRRGDLSFLGDRSLLGGRAFSSLPLLSLVGDRIGLLGFDSPFVSSPCCGSLRWRFCESRSSSKGAGRFAGVCTDAIPSMRLAESTPMTPLG